MNGKCPFDRTPLELNGDTLTCPQCGYAILQADFEKVWSAFEQTKSHIKANARKAVRKLINDLVVTYRIPKEENHGPEQNQ